MSAAQAGWMSDYTVTVTLQVSSDADRDRLKSLLDSGLRELPGIASRYGATVTGSSVSIEG
jgi:hypothetical protein